MPTPKSRPNGVASVGFSPAMKARLFLVVACFWPLWVLALFASSSANQDKAPVPTEDGGVQNPSQVMASHKSNTRMNLRSVLDRVDIMGYGPTHPRIVVVVVGESKEYLVSSVESVFRNTDMNRIFLICAVLDGQSHDDQLVEDLRKIDNGSVPHWHGLRPDIHFPGSSNNHENKEDEESHGRKVHVMFNPQREGVAASRLDAVDFAHLLEEKHEEAGMKSPEEDLILLFLQAGSQLTDRKWLSSVTNALIVPPPLIIDTKEDVALKLANAVSLRLEGPLQRTSFNEKLSAIPSEATAADINQSSGQSYPTPALNGAAVAMRLDTYLSLPAQDPSLMDAWPANLELALNLWLCGDGIDIVQDAEVTSFEETPHGVPLDSELAARFAAVWMDELTQQKFFQSFSTEITRLDWESKVARARHSKTFPHGMSKRCRSFEWFAKEVNPDIAKILENSRWEEAAKQESNNARQKKPATQLPVKPNKAKVDLLPPKPLSPEKKPAEAEALDILEEHHEPPKEAVAKPVVGDEVNEDVIPNLAQDHRRMPSVPLRKNNLDILQKAKPVDISFVDVSGGHKEHPHMGAKDENGEWGYVHDEKALRNNPPEWTWEEGAQAKACEKRDNNFRMMKERVVVDMDYDKEQNESGKKRDKIFCLVYTIEAGHPKIPLIRETWGPKCDGFMVGSTTTDKSIGAVEIPHEGPEEYNNIWQKVRSMWSYIYDNYYEEYDWFHIGGDDLFLLVENMRLYLESEEIRTAANGGVYLPDGTETTQLPLLLGRRFAYMGDMENIFDSGGSGYTMNKAAFKLLVVEGFPNYFPHAHTFSEDTMVAKIFRKMGVFPYDTKDDDGGERYMPFLPGHHWGYRLPEDPSKDWYAKYSIDIKEGAEHCSPKSIAFHYVKGPMMKRLFALAYDLCGQK